MIRRIHYFSTELKTKMMSSQGAALNINNMTYQIMGSLLVIVDEGE